MNEVKIVVSGTNKFAATQSAIIKQVQGVKSASESASKSMRDLGDATSKPQAAPIDKITKSLDKTKASAAAVADTLEKVAGKASGAEKVADSLNDSVVAAEALVKKVQRFGAVSGEVATRLPLRTVWRDAVRESGAAFDELVVTLYQAGTEAGAELRRALRLDLLQERLRVVGNNLSGVLHRALEPARRARAVLVDVADTVADAWTRTAEVIESAVDATRRIAVSSVTAAMTQVRRVRTVVVETSTSIAGSVGRGVDRVQARGRAAAATVADVWSRAADRVVARSKEIGAAASGAFDRVAEPVRVAGARAVEAAERVRSAWDRAAEPVFRYGRAVADVAGTTVRIAGRIVAPFGKVGAAVGGALGDAGQRGGRALARGVDSALDTTLASMKFWGGHVVALAESTWETAGRKANAMVTGVRNARDEIVGAVTGPFTAAIDRVTSALPAALNSPALMSLVAGAALPIGAAAGGAVVLGFGLGLATLGVVTAARTSEVRQQWQQMARGVSRDWQEVTTPFRATTKAIVGDMEDAFITLKPKLQRAFTTLAPALGDFSKGLFKGIGDFDVEPLSRAAAKVMTDLGGRMPRIVGGLSDSFTDLAESIEKNPKALGQFVEGLTAVAGHVISDLGTLNENFSDITEEVEMISNFFNHGKYELDADLGIAGFNRLNGVLQEVAASTDRQAESSYVAATGAERLEGAWGMLADAGGDVVKRGQGIVELLDVITGRVPSFEEAQQQINDSIRGLEDVFGDAKNWVDGYGDALIRADGTVNTSTANGSMLYDTIQDLKVGFSDAAASVRDLEDAGWSHDDAVRKVNDDMRIQYDRLLGNAGQMGLTREKMEELLAAYGLTPKFLDTIARLDENNIRAKLDMLAYTRTVIFRGVLDASQVPNGRSPDARAHGGVSGGGWTTVGELGPERVKLPSGSQVQPYTASARQQEPAGIGTGGGGGAAAVVLDLAGVGRATGLERVFLEWLKEAIRGRGGNAAVLG